MKYEEPKIRIFATDDEDIIRTSNVTQGDPLYDENFGTFPTRPQ